MAAYPLNQVFFFGALTVLILLSFKGQWQIRDRATLGKEIKSCLGWFGKRGVFQPIIRKIKEIWFR